MSDITLIYLMCLFKLHILCLSTHSLRSAKYSKIIITNFYMNKTAFFKTAALFYYASRKTFNILTEIMMEIRFTNISFKCFFKYNNILCVLICKRRYTVTLGTHLKRSVIRANCTMDNSRLYITDDFHRASYWALIN